MAENATTTNLETLHLRLIRDLGCVQPEPILGDCDALDLVDRAEHVQEILRTVTEYIAAIVEDTAWRAPAGAVDADYITNMLSDTASDIISHIGRKAPELQDTRRSKPLALTASPEAAE